MGFFISLGDFGLGFDFGWGFLVCLVWVVWGFFTGFCWLGFLLFGVFWFVFWGDFLGFVWFGLVLGFGGFFWFVFRFVWGFFC